jgi:hypothetical protein
MRRILILSMLDQAALSAFNFLLALLLIKYWSGRPEVFGEYAVILAGSLTLASVQNALVIGHMTVLRPKARGEDEETALLSMFWSANAVVTAGAMGVTYLGTVAALNWGGLVLGLSAALYVGSTLIREYTRSYHFSYLKVGDVLTQDAISLALSVIGIATAWYFGQVLTLNVLFLILAACQILASIPAIAKHRRHFRLSFGGKAWRDYLVVWREQSRWALLGVAATEFQQRGYVFIVALAFGTANVALLQAAALLFRPVQLLTHAWSKLARVILADHFANGRHAKARKFTLKSLGAAAAVYALYLGALALAWPLLKAHLFEGEFADVETIILLWCVAIGVITTTGVFSVEAQSMVKFRELSYGSILGAGVCGGILLVAVAMGDFRGSVVAVIGGQLAFLIVIRRILVVSDAVSVNAKSSNHDGAEEASAGSIPVRAATHEGGSA